MSKEQAFQVVVSVCGAYKNLNMQEAFQLKEALEVLGKELFPAKEEEKKENEPKKD